MRTVNEVADDMATEIKEAMESLESVYALIPKLLRGKVDKKKQRIEELLVEYEQAKEAKKPKIKRYATLKECLRDTVMWTGHFNRHELTAANWPTAPNADGDDEYPDEPVNLENCDFIELTDTKLVVAAGGDWQESTIMTMELVDGVLTVTHSEVGYKNGMDVEEFKKLLQ